MTIQEFIDKMHELDPNALLFFTFQGENNPDLKISDITEDTAKNVTINFDYAS